MDAAADKLPSNSTNESASIKVQNNMEAKDVAHPTKKGIVVINPNGDSVEAGFKLVKYDSGFLIAELDPANMIASSLKLLPNDKLLAIHNVDIRDWEQHVLEDFVKHMFDPDRNSMTLVIERDTLTNEDRCVVEIVVDYYIARGLGYRIAACARFLRRFASFTPVYCMQSNGMDVCLIATDTLFSQLYLKCEPDGTLTMCNLSYRRDPAYHFRRMIFHGFEKRPKENKSCFPCVLQSVCSGRYVVVKNCSSVGLTTKKFEDAPTILSSMTSIQKPDSRFFFLILSTIGEGSEYVLESSIFKDMFMAWDISEKKMKLIKSAKHIKPDKASNSTFHMYTYKEQTTK